MTGHAVIDRRGRRHRVRRWTALASAALLVPLAAACGGGGSSGGSSTAAPTTSAAPTSSSAPAPGPGPDGPVVCTFTQKQDLPPFEFGQPAGQVPDLPKRVAWANTSDADFFMQITNAIELAAKDRGIEFTTAIANDDSAKNIEQMETFLQRGVGAMAIQPLDAAAQAPVMQKAIDQGVAILSLVTPPSTNQAVADQYKVGNTQGLAAAKYITDQMGGKAKVVYFNTDSIEVLKARHQGVIDGLKTAGPGVEIVADIQPEAITQEAGAKAMATILQQHPDVDVVLGGDTYALGALSEIESQGLQDQVKYMSGIDGDAQALDLIKKGGTPYKASFAFAYPLMGYAWGQFAADWLEGKPIPQVMQFNAIELNSAQTIDDFQTAMKNVQTTWKDASKYFTMLGSVSYETRDKCITYAA